MSIQPPRRLDRDTAEQLLRGDSVALHRVGRLAALLRAARVPFHPDEVKGEEAALAAFLAAADLAHVPQQRRPSMLKIALAKLLSVKAAAALAAATGAGGLALAAGTGALPNPLADAPAAHAPTDAAGRPTTTPSHAGAADPAGSPSPSLDGLCKAYAAGAAANPGKVLDNPAFTVLVDAAGGAENVGAYCETMTSADGANPGRPSAVPTDKRPTAVPAPTQVGGAPTGRPDTPTTRPSAGAPATAPAGASTTPGSR